MIAGNRVYNQYTGRGVYLRQYHWFCLGHVFPFIGVLPRHRRVLHVQTHITSQLENVYRNGKP